MKPSFQWMHRLSGSLNRQLTLVAKGVSGADRREKQRLRRQLANLKAEYNLLTQELKQVRRELSLENRGLKARYEELTAERDDLQLEIWELENLIEELFGLLTTTEADHAAESVLAESLTEAAPIVELKAELASAEANLPVVTLEENPEESETTTLSGLKLALVGGHDATRRGVISELTQRHGLTQWVELPPFSKHSLGRSNIKAKIHDCDLIVLITGYMRHKQTESIMQLKRLESLSGDVLLLNCRGKSGVVREILNYIRQKYC